MSFDQRLREKLHRSLPVPDAAAVDGILEGVVSRGLLRRRRRRLAAGAAVLAAALTAALLGPRALDAMRSMERRHPAVPPGQRHGLITTVVGTGAAGSSGDGGLATKARLNYPVDLGFDGQGNLYVLDLGNPDNPGRVRKVDASGTITTVVGGGAPGEAGRVILGVTFGATGLAVDAEGNVYVGGGDGNYTNHQVIRVDPSSQVTTLAGTGEVGHSGDGGPATNATLGVVWDVALDSYGNLYMSVGNQVREVDTSGMITTLAGTGAKGFSGDGGPAKAAQLHHPRGVAVDAKGNVYILDIGNDRIRRIDTRGIITTIAGPGRGKDCFSGDGGPAIDAGFCAPEHLWVDTAGNLYVADTFSHRIRKIDTNGIVTTVAGDGSPSFSGDGGPAMHAGLSKASGVAVGPDGALYIADSGHDRVRRVVL